jgi:hypothetical protein
MVGRLAVQQMLQPGRQALQVLVARGQDARVDQHFPDVVQSLVLRQVIEQVVGDGVGRPSGRRALIRLARPQWAHVPVLPRTAQAPQTRPEVVLRRRPMVTLPHPAQAGAATV